MQRRIHRSDFAYHTILERKKSRMRSEVTRLLRQMRQEYTAAYHAANGYIFSATDEFIEERMKVLWRLYEQLVPYVGKQEALRLLYENCINVEKESSDVEVEEVRTRYDMQEQQEEARLFAYVQNFLHELVKPLSLRGDGRGWRVVDIACGQGEWVRQMAELQPMMEIIGLDHKRELIAYARLLVRIQNLHNAHFVAGEMQDMSVLITNFCDVIHASFIDYAVPPQSYYPLLTEIRRVCRPGGRFVWTEADAPVVSGPACKRWCELMRQTLLQNGKRASSGHKAPPIPQRMEALLKNAGWQNIQKTRTRIDLSAGTPAYQILMKNIYEVQKSSERFLSRMSILNDVEIDRLHQEVILELQEENFKASWLITTVVGEK